MDEMEQTTPVEQYLIAITMSMITQVLFLITNQTGLAQKLIILISTFVCRTLFFLMVWSIMPGAIMALSCVYMCVCSKFMFIGDDGHMRIFCCGKAVTGKEIPNFNLQFVNMKVLLENTDIIDQLA